MTEIKFKVWAPYIGKMSRVFSIKEIIMDRSIVIGYSDKTVCLQYTGLKDINGKEIYESDIVKIDHKTIIASIPDIFVYNFDDGCFVDGKDYEIVGNIYENPELLKNGGV